MKRKISPLIAAVAVAGAVAFLLIGCGDGGSGGSGPGPSGVIDALRASVPLKIRLKPPPKPVGGPSYPIATVRPGHTIALRDSPGGQVVDRVGDRTEFGSVRVFWIEKVRSGWFGVPVPELPDGRLDQGRPPGTEPLPDAFLDHRRRLTPATRAPLRRPGPR
jgi:hypothetical protein